MHLIQAPLTEEIMRMNSSSNRLLPPLALLCALLAGTVENAHAESARERASKLVAQILRADYEGDRTALQRLYQELTPLANDKKLGAKVCYWRGFAQWRRALNGFNDGASPSELEQSLKLAVSEFEAALAKDSAFVDAKVSAGSCLGLLMFLYGRNPTLAPEFKEPTRLREALRKALAFVNEAEAAEPDNPRVLWVLGQIRWTLPPAQGGGQDKAIETNERGLKAARTQKSSVRDPLLPSWGEPELLMNLAYNHQARKTPDFAAAEQYAQAALALVPHWHYVRDILIPQIAAAKAKRF